MKGSRRSFLASLFAIPVALAIPKPKPVVTYADTDSIVFNGEWAEANFQQALDRVNGRSKVVMKLYTNSMFGKFGSPNYGCKIRGKSSKTYCYLISKELT